MEVRTMPHYLTDECYQYGSYTRGALKGDILYGVFSFAGVEALITPGFALARDAWAERHRAALDPAQTKAYEAALRDCLKEAAADDAWFEDVHGAALALRRQFFHDEMDRLFLRDAEMPHMDLNKRDIDQSERLESLMKDGGAALFLLGDARYAALMRGDMQAAKQSGLSVYAAYSETERGVYPSRDQIDALLRNSGIQCLRCEGPLSGLEENEVLARHAREGRAFILYYGEIGLSACRNLAVPAFVRCVPESLVGKALAGQFLGGGRCDIFVPPHFDILPGVPLRKRTLAAYRQYAYLNKTYGDQVYAMSMEEMYRRWPQAFFSVYDETGFDLPKGAKWPESSADADWYQDFCARRDAALAGMLQSIPGVKQLGGWFQLDTMEKKPVPWAAEGEPKGILTHGVLLSRAKAAQVILAEGEALSPRRLAAEEKGEGTGLMLNYLFFLTPRLAKLYNQLREARPREQAELQCGHLDYMLYRRDGRRVETFPLFKKACMAMKEDGTFAFFHFRLGGGALTVNGREICWKKEDVDPEIPGGTAMFTPYLSCPDAGASKFAYTKTVGAGRVNLVIIQDRVICARDGDVLLPAMGVVLSLARERGLDFLCACGFAPQEDGYFAWQARPKISLTLDTPEEMPENEWRRVVWAYGGGLTLIHDGEDCFSDDETAAGHLRQEGWASPLSGQTQESDIAAMVRHPRTAIGLTRQNQLLALVYSGRSSVSAGADYREMCRIARLLAPDVKELMNVDGGGSAVLGITAEGRFFEYSWPSSSPGTLAGMARPINSIFRIRL